MPTTAVDDPDTSLSGVELLLTKVRRRSFADRSGQTLGLTWAAYRDDSGLKVYVMKKGDLLRRPDLRLGRHRRYRYPGPRTSRALRPSCGGSTGGSATRSGPWRSCSPTSGRRPIAAAARSSTSSATMPGWNARPSSPSGAEAAGR
jgi:hypothetical protein